MVKKSLKYQVLEYASRPESGINYDKTEEVEFRGKRYLVNLSKESVIFVGNIKKC